MDKFIIIIFVSFFVHHESNNVFMEQPNAGNPAEAALNYIKAFQQGVAFRSPSAGIIVNGHPDMAAIKILKEHLVKENAAVRENIVNLIVDIGTHTGPAVEDGTEVIHNTELIKILYTEGLIKADLGRDRTVDALRKLCLATDLVPGNDSYIQAFKLKPSEGLLLLMAKAKTMQAKELVGQLVLQNDWKNVEAVKIAAAALGDETAEQLFVDKLNNAAAAGHAAEAGQAFRPLSLIGTPRTLKLIAEYLRTALVIDKPGAYKKSVRLDVLEALRYNFPDQTVLYPNNIKKEADYAAAETFCINKFGAAYKTAPPPFMTYKGYPMRVQR